MYFINRQIHENVRTLLSILDTQSIWLALIHTHTGMSITHDATFPNLCMYLKIKLSFQCTYLYGKSTSILLSSWKVENEEGIYEVHFFIQERKIVESLFEK